jgi:hypothetical protein
MFRTLNEVDYSTETTEGGDVSEDLSNQPINDDD